MTVFHLALCSLSKPFAEYQANRQDKVNCYVLADYYTIALFFSQMLPPL